MPYGMARAGLVFGDPPLIDWALRWFEFHHAAGYTEETAVPCIHSGERIAGHHLGEYCGNWGGPLVFAALYRARPKPELKEAAGIVCEALLRQASRLPDRAITHDGGWDHPRGTLWVDTLFYSSSILAEAYSVTGQRTYAEEAVRQALLHAKWLQDPGTGGFFHDVVPATGARSTSLWARGNGWAILALADTLRLCPADLPGWSDVLSSYRALATGMLRYQHSSGLWRIVPGNPDAHLETSGSLMILAGLANGLAAGWIDPSVRGPVMRGFNELQTWIDPRGVLQGAQGPAGVGGWETHKLSTLGECAYATGLFWRLLADLRTARLLESGFYPGAAAHSR
jgi:rhamnogalacturonyl hydrolase YesR